jgi:hypothetical protein
MDDFNTQMESKIMELKALERGDDNLMQTTFGSTQGIDHPT